MQIKIGHGGTLDPMATGVLIMGVGKGTKRLREFLECTKTYEATVLFGAATDTYDVLGKVVRRADHRHVTREGVEQALSKFKGKILQRPPVYSALRMQGKRLYEYAREGKAIPKDIEYRTVEVKELEIKEWMEGGSHKFCFPSDEAEDKAQDVAESVLYLGETGAKSTNKTIDQTAKGIGRTGTKRKISLDNSDILVSHKRRELGLDEAQPLTSGGLQGADRSSEDPLVGLTSQEDSLAPAEGPPAVRLLMTVTSGFYVRSFSHDIGEAMGSLACMCALVRTKQGNFELGKNVLEYEDLKKGEDVWGPKIGHLLAESSLVNEGLGGVTHAHNVQRR